MNMKIPLMSIMITTDQTSRGLPYGSPLFLLQLVKYSFLLLRERLKRFSARSARNPFLSQNMFYRIKDPTLAQYLYFFV